MEALKVTVIVCLVVGAMFSGGGAYPTGPPVGWANVTGLCVDMTPQHGFDKQTTPAPFDITFDPQCFKAGDTIKVKIGNDSLTFYEGFFVQARQPGKNDANVGTFNTDGDTRIKTLPCFGISDSAISHGQKFHYWTHQFSWKAPATQLNHDIVFEATMVHETEEFWVGVYSETLERCDTSGSPKEGVQTLILIAAITFFKLM